MKSPNSSLGLNRPRFSVGFYITVLSLVAFSFCHDASAQTFSVDPAANYTVGSAPYFVAAADFNGDNNQDLVVTNNSNDTLSILLGNGDGTLQAQTTLNTSTQPFNIIVMDLNGDQKPDIAFNTTVGQRFSVFIGNGDGTFQTRVDYNTGFGGRQLRVADVNNDGKRDALVLRNNSILLFLGNGDGTFQAPSTITVPNDSNTFDLLHVDGDAHLDIIVAEFAPMAFNDVSKLLGNGDGTFGAPSSIYNTLAQFTNTALADLNSDGLTDAVFAHSNGLDVVLASGVNAFAAPTSYNLATTNSVLVADLNGDRVLDLVYSRQGFNEIGYLQGNGDGTFAAGVNIGVGSAPIGVGAIDLNGDGKLDIVSSNAASNNVSVLVNTTPAPEIDVRGNSTSITSGDASPSSTDNTDFGNSTVGSIVSKSFSIFNTGAFALSVGGTPKVALGGTHAGDFSVTTQPAGSIATSASSNFTISFSPSVVGLRSATVTISNTDPNESTYTFSIQGTGLSATDTDGDGTPDTSDTDDDNDGVSDTQETSDGTSSLDADSYYVHGNVEYCYDWNGYLSDITQILELRNAGSNSLTLNVDLRNSSGVTQSSVVVGLNAGRQFDVIVNDLAGFTTSAYGTVCATIVSGDGDSLESQVSQYKLSGTSFNYAFATRYVPPQAGKQYVGYNHYFPALTLAELSNFVAGYVQVINDESTTQTGTLVFYDASGAETKRVDLALAAKGRVDIGSHDNNSSLLGLVEWVPTSTTAKFRMAMNRYYFNGSTPTASRRFVVSQPAKRGVGAELRRPFSSIGRVAVLEVNNTLATSVNISLNVYHADGSAVFSPATGYNIPAKGTQHIVLNSALTGELGSFSIQASTAGAVIASLLEYRYDSNLIVRSMSVGEADIGLAAALSGTYNNYLGGCLLRLSNLSSSQKTGTYSLTRSDGTPVVSAQTVTLSGNASTEINICGSESQTAYGSVSVLPNSANSLIGEIVRLNSNGNAEFRAALLRKP